MRLFLTLLFTAALASCVLAQTWEPLKTDNFSGQRRIHPKTSLTVSTDGEALRNLLFNAPHERNVPADNSNATLILPLPDGGSARYRIVAYDIAEAPALAKYPNIRTWYGLNVDNPAQSIFLDWTERGFHASVRGGGTEAFFVDPLHRRSTDQYQVYRKSDFDPDQVAPFTCHTEHGNLVEEDLPETTNKALGDCELMQYRTTMTATGEYSNYHGATSSAQSGLVQSAIVTTVNRVNQVFTRDISLRLLLVGNNDLLYNYDPDTDPFPVNDVSSLINQNTSYTTGIIGNNNYDYGHIVTQANGGGIASLRASCIDSRKAAGATSRPNPEGDPFDIDYVAHEMGHNFGGNHTQNNSCNYSSSAGMEPGSASSIMGYAGICTPNVQNQSDDYFHGRSIEEMTTHFELGSGGCGTIINTSLNNPVVTAQSDETIPAGTPFVLKSAATGNGTLSYNWEQYDAEQGDVMPPVGTNVEGPLFRSFDPVASTERFFPNLPDVIDGVDPTWEATPTVSRNMSFRATVINYNASYGCASEDDINITVDASDRPFVVTDPNNGNQWSAGQTAQVQWDVAETNGAPYNSQIVDVLLSTDGGATFQTLLTDASNNGLAQVTVPAQTSSNARIMVRSKDNVFYNVSQQDFSIVSSAGAPAIGLTSLSPLNYTECFTDSEELTFDFVTSSAGGATAPITWSVTNLPAGVSQSYSLNPIRPGGSFSLTLDGLSSLPNGTSQLTLVGNSTDGQLSESITIEKTSGGSVAGPTTIAPTGADVDLRPVLQSAVVGSSTYDIQLANTPDFSTLLYSVTNATTPELSIPDYLSGNTVYYWRVRTRVDCGISQWSEASFVTADCRVFGSTAAPAVIDDGPAVQIATMDLTVPVAGTITDVDLYQLDVEHTYIEDLNVDLIHPDGTEVRVWARECDGQNNMFISFDDESTETTYPCPPVAGGFFPPSADPLTDFDNKDAAGTWTLSVTDNANRDGGFLNGFSVKICLENAALPVSFLEFNAEGKKNYVALDWVTESESGNYGFFVERSQQGANAGAWDVLGFVAAGTDYRYDDRTALPHTDYLYRLRQQDLDGRVTYSEVRTARFGESSDVVNLFPNPTSGNIQYRLVGADADLPYELIDINGRILEKGLLATGGGTISLDTRVAGVYLVRVAGGTFRVVKL
ncbi:T9SS type A sorting domain-containing protein [Neolewinella aurantiaca]|uniref:T9SS type A sorting domain-containing protein n=1 Tax=Neolewinella aurantiaca TaxID=2602767 RepID=A0A5C7F9D0_9BACT|nr:zinc-dependent metalloprotease family protein [Neolewinella aurantiaca]TXF85988.1 T9SS type A sorting domain-containing protein [Neolewinella aurantiaca]